MTLVAALAKVAISVSLLGTSGAGTVKVTVTGPGHAPRVGTHWTYTVAVTRGGKPAAGKLTEEIVDPIGGAHAVEFGKGTKKILDWPVKGTFTDFIIWPPESRGIPLRLRVTVTVGSVKRVVTYAVTPRG